MDRYGSGGTDCFAFDAANKHYPVSLKIAAVQEYLIGGITQREICLKHGIRSVSLLYERRKAHANGMLKKTHAGGRSRINKCRNTTQRERFEIVEFCLSNNKNYGLAIEKYGVSYSQIYSWVRKYEAHVVDELFDGRGNSRPESVMSEARSFRHIGERKIVCLSL